MNKKLAGILILLMALSLVATGLLGVSRMKAERAAKTVDIVLDYEEFAEMARQSGKPLENWFEFFASQGVQNVALNEETFRSLKRQGNAISYATRLEFTSKSRWDEGLPVDLNALLRSPESDDYDLVVETSDAALAKFIETGLSTRVGNEFYKSFQGADTTYFVLNGTIDQALYETGSVLTGVDGKVVERPDVYMDSILDRIGIGFDIKKIETIRKSGLEVLVRPINNPLAPDRALAAFEKDFSTYKFKSNYVIFSGQEVLGYVADDVMSLDRLIQTLDRLGLSSSLIEAGNQRGHVETRGAEYIAENSNYNVIRVFPIVRYIQKRVGIYNYQGSEEIENTIYRAVTERNLRSIYFRPFLENDRIYLTDPAEYTRMFTSLKSRLADHGLSLGDAGVMAFNHPPLSLRFLAGVGLVAASIWLLSVYVPLSTALGLGLAALAILGMAGVLFLAPNLSTSLLGLAASLIFPAISTHLLVDRLRKLYTSDKTLELPGVLIAASAALILTFAVSLVGGLFIGGLLSSSSYLIEIDYFRGVKLSLAAPVAAAALFYILRFGFKRSASETKGGSVYWKDILNVLEASIQVKHLAMLGAGAVVAYIYISRSGHETEVQPSDLEMIMRNTLEQIFLARPRTKEFLMAFPALMVAVAFAARKRRAIIFPLLLVASLGFSSIVNTFSHLRTPLYLSTVRELYALGIGLIIGILAVVAALMLDALYAAWKRSRDHA
jgi:hypothetical protein